MTFWYECYEDENGYVYRVSFEYGLYRCRCEHNDQSLQFDTLPKSWKKVQ